MLSGSGKKVMVRKEIRGQANPTDNSQCRKPILHNYPIVFSFTPSGARSRGVSPLETTAKNARRGFELSEEFYALP